MKDGKMENPRPAVLPSQIGGETIGLSSATIMMVDDEPIMMEMAKSFLEEAGYAKFVLVDRSTEALKILIETQPDVLLLDLMMPEVTGFDILTKMRESDDFRYLPVIVLTSSTDAETKLKALELGATDFLAKPVDPSELVLRLRNTLAAKAYQDQLTYYDLLTGMPNRRLFREQVSYAIRNAHRQDALAAVLHIGLDRFRQINDSYGTAAGDCILREAARRLQQCIRETDSSAHLATDSNPKNVARLGDDEFGAVLYGLANMDDAGTVARRIQHEIAGAYKIDGKEIFVTASIGIAGFPCDGDVVESLTQNAHSAMVQAKQRGKGSLQFYSSEINARSCARMQLETDLRKALKNGELSLHFQPKVMTQTSSICGVEALLRWQHPEIGAVSPADFIPLAEESGLIVPIGAWVLRQACSHMQMWEKSGLGKLSVAVNTSAIQLQKGELQLELRKALDASGIEPCQLTLELTESAIMDSAERDTNAINSLKAMGVKLAIDDFGTGYSSLSYLKRFSLDELKIDRSFIADLPDSPDDSSIVRAIVAMSHSLGMRVVAEGVETEAQLEFLREIGCEIYQGYYFSKALPANEFVAQYGLMTKLPTNDIA